jgi:hypothetical protein
MDTVYLCDDGNAEIEIEAADEYAAAQAYVDGGDWGEHGIETTRWVRVHVHPRGANWDDGDWIRVEIEPEEPDCPSEKAEHDWRRPIEYVGGIAENPGVRGHGGGVTIAEVCVRCGARRVTDTWAQCLETGEQGLTSITYEPPGTVDVDSNE